MSNPNIINLTEYYPGLAYVSPTGNNTGVVLLSNSSTSNSAIKVNSIIATNKSVDNVEIIVSINTSAAGTGTNYNLAYKIVVPFGASLQIVEKGSGIYLTEDKSIVVSTAIGNSMDFIASFETFK